MGGENSMLPGRRNRFLRTTIAIALCSAGLLTTVAAPAEVATYSWDGKSPTN